MIPAGAGRPSPKVKVAAVTMTYNEPDYLPIWLRHYARQVGARHCYVVDHGSTDGSADRVGAANRLRIPRSPLDETKRARFVSSFVASLLEWYDWVIHTDVDEIAFADPAVALNLRRYCARLPHQQVTAFGFNLVHASDEPALDLAAPILPQRRWFSFSAALSKPALTRRAPIWSGGFHRADAPTVFGDLYMVHLRYADRAAGLRRIAKSRAQEFADATTNLHHRDSDTQFSHLFDNHDRRPRMPDVAVRAEAPELRAAIAAAFGPPGGPEHYLIDYDVPQLWPVPERFRTW